jgi:hypothetical protein
MTIDAGTFPCSNHPYKKTRLRCNKCNRPVCKDCIQLTPVGYRCKQCIQDGQKRFETIRWYDYVSTFGLAVVLSAVFGLLVVNPFCYAIAGSPVAGVIIASIVTFITQGRKGRFIPWIASLGLISGGLVSYFFPYLLFNMGAVSLNDVVGIIVLLWPMLYIMLSLAGFHYKFRQDNKIK